MRTQPAICYRNSACQKPTYYSHRWMVAAASVSKTVIACGIMLLPFMLFKVIYLRHAHTSLINSTYYRYFKIWIALQDAWQQPVQVQLTWKSKKSFDHSISIRSPLMSEMSWPQTDIDSLLRQDKFRGYIRESVPYRPASFHNFLQTKVSH